MDTNNSTILLELEKMRKGKLVYFIFSRIVKFAFVFSLLGYLYAFFMNIDELEIQFGFTMFLLFMVVPFCVYEKKYDRIVKETLFNKNSFQIKNNQINWKSTELSTENFIADYGKHNIFKINKTYFKSDDTFYGSSKGVNFSIFEISNKRNSFLAIFKIAVDIFSGLFFTLLLATVGGVIAGLVCRFVQAWHPYFNQFFIAGWLLAIPFMFWFTTRYLTAKNGFNILRCGDSINSVWDTDCNIYDSFQGVVVDFEYKKNFKGHTIIFENNEENNLVKAFLARGYEKVELEDVVFNKKFSVYTTDQVEARYVLTAGLMERFNQLSYCFKSKYIRASFMENKLVLAIQSNEDLFQLGSLIKGVTKELLDKTMCELDFIVDIVDKLNLNNQVGL